MSKAMLEDLLERGCTSVLTTLSAGKGLEQAFKAGMEGLEQDMNHVLGTQLDGGFDALSKIANDSLKRNIGKTGLSEGMQGVLLGTLTALSSELIKEAQKETKNVTLDVLKKTVQFLGEVFSGLGKVIIGQQTVTEYTDRMRKAFDKLIGKDKALQKPSHAERVKKELRPRSATIDKRVPAVLSQVAQQEVRTRASSAGSARSK